MIDYQFFVFVNVCFFKGHCVKSLRSIFNKKIPSQKFFTATVINTPLIDKKINMDLK